MFTAYALRVRSKLTKSNEETRKMCAQTLGASTGAITMLCFVVVVVVIVGGGGGGSGADLSRIEFNLKSRSNIEFRAR